MGVASMVCIRGFDMPAAEVELCHSYESLYGVFNFGYREQSLGMGHEAISVVNNTVALRMF